MKIKPSTPFFELATIGVPVYFFVKTLSDQEMGDKRFVLAGFFLFLIVFFIYLFNRNFIKSLEIGNSVIVKKFFWGKEEMKLSTIKGYKLKEVKRTKLMISDYNLVFIDNKEVERIQITQGDFKSDNWNKLIDELKTLNVEFLGYESLANQWKSQWSDFKKRFVK